MAKKKRQKERTAVWVPKKRVLHLGNVFCCPKRTYDKSMGFLPNEQSDLNKEVRNEREDKDEDEADGSRV